MMSTIYSFKKFGPANSCANVHLPVRQNPNLSTIEAPNLVVNLPFSQSRKKWIETSLTECRLRPKRRRRTTRRLVEVVGRRQRLTRRRDCRQRQEWLRSENEEASVTRKLIKISPNFWKKWPKNVKISTKAYFEGPKHVLKLLVNVKIG
jgi:hypothetical protein